MSVVINEFMPGPTFGTGGKEWHRAPRLHEALIVNNESALAHSFRPPRCMAGDAARGLAGLSEMLLHNQDAVGFVAWCGWKPADIAAVTLVIWRPGAGRELCQRCFGARGANSHVESSDEDSD